MKLQINQIEDENYIEIFKDRIYGWGSSRIYCYLFPVLKNN